MVDDANGVKRGVGRRWSGGVVDEGEERGG